MALKNSKKFANIHKKAYVICKMATHINIYT